MRISVNQLGEKGQNLKLICFKIQRVHFRFGLEQTLSRSPFIILTAPLSEFGTKHSYFTMRRVQEMR